MHTDHTLNLLSALTSSLGQHFRDFVKKTCPAFSTRELQREANARKRREVNAKDTAAAASCTARQPKDLNLETYKFHSLGDYARMIATYGTCDSYSTELVSIGVFSALPDKLTYRT